MDPISAKPILHISTDTNYLAKNKQLYKLQYLFKCQKLYTLCKSKYVGKYHKLENHKMAVKLSKNCSE